MNKPVENTVMITGRLPTDLSNEVSDAIHKALTRGMEPDEAVCVAMKVALDYGRHSYGDQYGHRLREMIATFMSQPAPPPSVRREVT